MRAIHNELNQLKYVFSMYGLQKIFMSTRSDPVTDPDQQALDAAALDMDLTRDRPTTLELYNMK